MGIVERIKKVMAAIFGVDILLIDNDITQGSLEQWDSLRHMNLILALEEEFNVRFRDNQMDQLISLRLIELNLIELLKSKENF